MKTTKFLTAAIIVSGLTFTACGNDKKETTDTMESNETEMYQSDLEANNQSEMENPAQVIMTRQYAMNDGTKINYDLNEEGVTGFEAWEPFNTLSYEIREINNVDLVVTNERINSWNGTIMNLDKTIPSWLKTEEVMEDVADIQKEYKELVAELNAPEKERKENLEELTEQFDDLREELTETINEYIKVNKEAIEEYNEEAKKGKMEAAKEEYKEEIKKEAKIADYKEKK
tara:strand:+ start:368 stop:1057 length:690 start_codon:yes stop_codon:yes gene_type:complete